MSTLPSFLKDATCGFVGGFCGTYVGMPFDTIKVRLQTTNAKIFTSPLHAATRTVRDEGITALWRGSTPALASALTENLVVFAANGIIRRAVAAVTIGTSPHDHDHDDHNEHYLGLWKEMMIGGASGFCSATAICPAEVLKCRLQANRSVHNATLWTTGTALYHQEGVAGFFRGLPALWVRDVPFYVVFFTTYTTYINAALHYHAVPDKSLLPTFHFVFGGGLAGACGWACVFPCDVIKSRMQVGTLHASMSLVAAATTLWKQEGAKKLMRGWGPAVLRGFPANGALFFGVEMTQRMFEE